MQMLVLGVLGLILVANILFGLGRGFGRTSLRFGTLFVAFLVAYFLSSALAEGLAESITALLEPSLASTPEMQQFFEENPSFLEAVQVIVRVGCAPLIFFLAYAVLKVITWVIYFIVAKIIFPKKKAEEKQQPVQSETSDEQPEQDEVPVETTQETPAKKPKKTALSRLGGAGVGVLISLFGMLAFLTPVLGYTGLAGEVVTAQEAEQNGASDEATDTVYSEYLAPLQETPVASALYKAIGKPMFDHLTSTEWHGTDFSLSHEIHSALMLMDGLVEFAQNTNMATYGEKESNAIHKLADGVSDSVLFSTVGAEVLSNASNAWLKGETYLGMERPISDDGNGDLVLNGILRVFSTSTVDNIDDDLDAIADMFELLTDHKMFELLAEDAEEGAFVRKLAQSEFIDEALALMEANPRLEPITTAFVDAGMRMLIQEVGLPENLEEEFPELVDDISGVLQNAVDEEGNIDKESIKNDLQTVITEHNLEVEEAATELIAEGLATEFTAEELQTMTIDEIADRLIERLGAVEGKDFAAAQALQ